MTSPNVSAKYIPGLADIVAAQTRLSAVNGRKGELIIAGFPVEELAGKATFEEVAYLLWNDTLPTVSQLDDFRGALRAQRALQGTAIDVLRAAAERHLSVMDALCLAAGTLNLDLADKDPQ